MTDCISNVISIINNGLKAKLLRVNLPGSNKVSALLATLKDGGYIVDFISREIRSGVREITVELKYSKFGLPAIRSLSKISKPGRRVYSGIKDLKSYSSGMGVYILSTSIGIISERQARSENVGGEVLCRVF